MRHGSAVPEAERFRNATTPSPRRLFSRRTFAAVNLCLALLLPGGGTEARASNWAAGWTRTPSPVANWSHLAVSSDASTIAAIGWKEAADGEEAQRIVAVSEDTGSTWRTRPLPSTAAPYWVSHLAVSGDGSLLVVAGPVEIQAPDGTSRQETSLVTSEDHGATWNRLGLPGETAQYLAEGGMISSLSVSRDGRSILVAVAGFVCLSQDRGRTWTIIRRPEEFWMQWVAVSGDGSTLAIAESSQAMLLSRDSGRSWSEHPLPELDLASALSGIRLNRDGGGVVALPQNGPLLRSDDQGLNWRTMNLPISPASWALSDAGSRLLIAPPNRQWHNHQPLPLFFSADSGATWESVDLGWVPLVAMSEDGSVQVAAPDSGAILINGVLFPPTLLGTEQTGSVALVDDATVTFRVDATGGALSYQWRRNGVDLEDAPARMGTRTRELILTATSSADLGTYSVVVSNLRGLLETPVGELKMTLPRIVASAPGTPFFASAGDPVPLTVQVEGGEIGVEWMRDGQSLGQRGSWDRPGLQVLRLTDVPGPAFGQFSVRVRNPLGEIVAPVAWIGRASWARADAPAAAWRAVAMSGTGDRIVACTPDQVLSSGDAGRSWVSWTVPGDDWSSVAVGRESGSVVLGQGHGAHAPAQPTFGFRSTDDGRTWTPWNHDENGSEWRTTSVASSADGQTLVITQEIPAWGPWGLELQYGALRFSHDGGQTWQGDTVEVFIAYGMNSATCSDDGRGMAVVRHDFFEGFKIKVSLDGGATWRSSVLPSSGNPQVRMSGDGRRLVAIAGRTLYACDSDSLAWQPLPAPEADWSAVALSRDGQRICAAASGLASVAGLIHQSDDGGQTWRWSGSPSANWTALACSADGERVVGVSSQGLFLSPGPNTSGESPVPMQATRSASGVRFVWRGTPQRTYRLLSTPSLDGRPWRSAGAVVADADGYVFLDEPAIGHHGFWQAVGIGE